MLDLNKTELFVHKLVDKSGEEIRKHFRNIDNIVTKEDKSPVTIADKNAEQILRDMIISAYPDHGITGEEFGSININARYKWIIDPIDGTLSFMIGRPIFGTLLALLDNGKPIVSVIDQPINKERWIASVDNGCKFNGNLVKTRKCMDISNAVIATTSLDYFNTNKKKNFYNLSKSAKHVVYGGDCYLYALIASGFLDLAIDSCLKAHDFLPIIPIIEEAGGIITDWQGEKLNQNSIGDIIISGDINIHKQAIKLLQ
jgi:inositol-phosphate phosphatase/L-galactose 1-phosphate phosphatase/histidinol-phosphatase